MTFAQIQNPFPVFTNAVGSPITGGRIYIGIAGLDPEANPQAVYWDAAGATPASQPLVMKGGFVVNGATPAVPYTAGAYSMRVYDALGNVVLYDANAPSSGFTAPGTGGVTRTVQVKLAELPKSTNDYDTFAHYAAQALTGAFFTQNGANISRIERAMVGGAVLNDCAYPNINQDWLTVFQIGTGLSSGSVTSSQIAAINSGTTSETGAAGLLGGIQTKYFASAGTNGLANNAYLVNNHATLATNGWAFYGEAHKTTAAAGSTYGMELDTRALVATIAPTPFQQGDVVGLQLASGAGVSATGQFDGSAALQIAANPMKWKVGINFLAGSLTSGLAINLAAQASGPHRIQWTNAAGNGAGFIQSTAVTAVANNITFTDNGLQITGADGSAVAYFSPQASGANWLAFTAAQATVAPQITVAGSDTNIDLKLTTKGTGVLAMGTAGMIAANGAVATAMTSVGPTGSHTTVQEWMMVKNPSGTVRYIPLY